MNRVILFLMALILTGCIGSRLYFDKPTRYDIKLSMLKMQKHYEILLNWADGREQDRDPAVSVDQLIAEGGFLINQLPDRNPVIWQETIREMQQSLEFLGDSIREDQQKRAGYHLRNIRKSCTDCHVRFRAGFNF